MTNVVSIKPCTNTAERLRAMADKVESGEMANVMTIICEDSVFSLGIMDDDQAHMRSIVDCATASLLLVSGRITNLENR